eukprot:scaffold228091_cov48-Prasinocladus_malaysianus.AAC.2
MGKRRFIHMLLGCQALLGNWQASGPNLSAAQRSDPANVIGLISLCQSTRHSLNFARIPATPQKAHYWHETVRSQPSLMCLLRQWPECE